jgi:hypothetical protein
LGEIAAFERTITNCEAVEFYNGNSNFVTICAVAIPRNEDENAFEAYNRHSPYVSKIVEQMSKKKEGSHVNEDHMKANLNVGARR